MKPIVSCVLTAALLAGSTAAQCHVEALLSPGLNPFSRFFGASLVVDGSHMLTGPFEIDGVSAVAAYENPGLGSEPIQILPNPAGPSAGVLAGFIGFGDSIAMDGDRALVGSPNGVDGVAWLYEFSQGAWSPVLAISEPGIDLGQAVALEGDRLAVSGPGVFPGQAPQVFTYRWTGAELESTGSVAALGDPVSSLHLEDRLLVINTLSLGLERLAKVYTKDPTQGWSLVQEIPWAGERRRAELISGHLFLGQGSSGLDSTVEVYVRSAQGFEKAVTIDASDVLPADWQGFFGTHVALRGSRLAIGSQRESGSIELNGRVDILQLTGSSWSHLGTVAPQSDAPVGDAEFGHRVAFQSDALLVSSSANAPFVLPRYERVSVFTGETCQPEPTSIEPEALPLSLAGDDLVFTIVGENLLNVAGVQVGGEAVEYSAGAGAIEFRLPAESPPGVYGVEVLFEGGSTAFSIALELPSAPLLAVTSPPLGPLFPLKLVVLGQALTPLQLYASLSSEPSTLPGLVELGLGAGFSELTLLDSIELNATGNGASETFLPLLPGVQPLFVQAVSLVPDALGAYATSNVVSVNL